LFNVFAVQGPGHPNSNALQEMRILMVGLDAAGKTTVSI
jgi:GTPase SAR1 family protein